MIPKPIVICSRVAESGESLPEISEASWSKRSFNSIVVDIQGKALAGKGVLITEDGLFEKCFDSFLIVNFNLKVRISWRRPLRCNGDCFLTYNIFKITPKRSKEFFPTPFGLIQTIKRKVWLSLEDFKILFLELVVVNMKPKKGPATEETEVWIRGYGFTQKGFRRRNGLIPL